MGHKEIEEYIENHFEVRESDIKWTKNHLSMLRVGGVWGTSYCIYQKKSETCLLLIFVNLLVEDAVFNIYRDRKVFKASGYKLDFGLESI